MAHRKRGRTSILKRKTVHNFTWNGDTEESTKRKVSLNPIRGSLSEGLDGISIGCPGPIKRSKSVNFSEHNDIREFGNTFLDSNESTSEVELYPGRRLKRSMSLPEEAHESNAVQSSSTARTPNSTRLSKMRSVTKNRIDNAKNKRREATNGRPQQQLYMQAPAPQQSSQQNSTPSLAVERRKSCQPKHSSASSTPKFYGVFGNLKTPKYKRQQPAAAPKYNDRVTGAATAISSTSSLATDVGKRTPSRYSNQIQSPICDFINHSSILSSGTSPFETSQVFEIHQEPGTKPAAVSILNTTMDERSSNFILEEETFEKSENYSFSDDQDNHVTIVAPSDEDEWDEDILQNDMQSLSLADITLDMDNTVGEVHDFLPLVNEPPTFPSPPTTPHLPLATESSSSDFALQSPVLFSDSEVAGSSSSTTSQLYQKIYNVLSEASTNPKYMSPELYEDERYDEIIFDIEEEFVQLPSNEWQDIRTEFGAFVGTIFTQIIDAKRRCKIMMQNQLENMHKTHV